MNEGSHLCVWKNGLAQRNSGEFEYRPQPIEIVCVPVTIEATPGMQARMGYSRIFVVISKAVSKMKLSCSRIDDLRRHSECCEGVSNGVIPNVCK